VFVYIEAFMGCNSWFFKDCERSNRWSSWDIFVKSSICQIWNPVKHGAEQGRESASLALILMMRHPLSGLDYASWGAPCTPHILPHRSDGGNILNVSTPVEKEEADDRKKSRRGPDSD
jgi:hypothetical protein